MLKVLILGVNGFIGHHLTRHIIEQTDWQVYGMDMQSDRVAPWMDHPRFHFFEGDITINKEWIEYHVRKCDVVLPLVAIATPATYVREPLRVFELDFEANLPIVRQCVKYGKRVVFPSTSEVYGMCTDDAFDPEQSNLVYGPINKPRWIYACSKQLLDRVIHAYGMQEGLRYTLFRPFNWIGPGLDSLHTPKEGSSRVITQFLGHIVRGEPIRLVDGGSQKRTFTYVDDGITCPGEDHRQCGRHGRRQDLQHRQSGQQLLDPRAGRDDAEGRKGVARVPRQRRPRAPDRSDCGGLLRRWLPGRVAARAGHPPDDGRSGLGSRRWRMDEALAALFAYYRDQVQAAELEP